MHPERQRSVIYVPVADRKRKIKLHNPLIVSSQKTHRKNKKRRICVKRQVPPPQLTGRKTRKCKNAKRFSFGTICSKKKKEARNKRRENYVHIYSRDTNHDRTAIPHMRFETCVVPLPLACCSRNFCATNSFAPASFSLVVIGWGRLCGKSAHRCPRWRAIAIE